jgi:hypothetical protein
VRALPVVVVVAVSTLFAGCPAVDLKELQFTRTKPAESDIVGTWRPTADTLKDIRGRGHYPVATHEINLRADHTFSMRNMPDWWSNGFGESHGQFESGDGTWQFEAGKDVWQIWVVRLHFPSVTTWINLYRQRPPYLIFIRVGDPNNGDAMFFERATKT